MLEIELREGRPIEAILRELYHDRQMTLEEVGAQLGIDKSSVSDWMWRLGIELRLPGQRPQSAA